MQRARGVTALVSLNLDDDWRLAPGAGIACPDARICCDRRPRTMHREEQKLLDVALVVDQAAVDAKRALLRGDAAGSADAA